MKHLFNPIWGITLFIIAMAAAALFPVPQGPKSYSLGNWIVIITVIISTFQISASLIVKMFDK